MNRWVAVSAATVLAAGGAYALYRYCAADAAPAPTAKATAAAPADDSKTPAKPSANTPVPAAASPSSSDDQIGVDAAQLTPDAVLRALQALTQGARNRYFVCRHGESEANVLKVISSNPALATVAHGLTELGRAQAATAAATLQELVARAGAPTPLVIVTSDFKRAAETAAVLHSRLRPREPVRVAVGLRERGFGAFEGGAGARYGDVWKSDAALGPDHIEHGVESTRAVFARALAVVHACEQRYSGAAVVLVSHGDTLQILSTAAHGASPGGDVHTHLHRSLPHLNNCEVRALHFAPAPVEAVADVKAAPAPAAAAAVVAAPEVVDPAVEALPAKARACVSRIDALIAGVAQHKDVVGWPGVHWLLAVRRDVVANASDRAVSPAVLRAHADDLDAQVAAAQAAIDAAAASIASLEHALKWQVTPALSLEQRVAMASQAAALGDHIRKLAEPAAVARATRYLTL